ncbi:MAG: EAL domain-containing protein [Zoogloeaceae bacterium]|nr:EAL domain-containing protein [Zoogloeaceae bacterium]
MPPIPPQSQPPQPHEPFIADFSEGLETGLYLALLELIDEGLIITGDEIMIDANSAACRLLERDYRQLVGKPLSELFPNERAFLEARDRLLIQGEMRGSIQIALPGGRRRDMRFIAAARLRPGMHALILSPDIVAEAYGREHAGGEDRVWPRLAAAIGQALIVVDEGGRVQAMNAAAHRDLGVDGGDVIGRRLDELLEVSWPDGHEPPFASVSGRRARVVPGPRSGWRLLLIEEEGRTSQAAAATEPFEPRIEPVVDVASGEQLACAVVLPPPALRPDAEVAAAFDGRVLRFAAEMLASGRASRACVSLRSAPDAALVARVRAELVRSAVPATLLELGFDAVSLTLADDGGAALDALRALGMRTALDDVGAGPFALAQLAAGRIDVVRVSASLVQALAHEEHAEALIEGIAGLATGFRAEVRVCGIRSPAERDFLAALGCTQQQGPLFARESD